MIKFLDALVLARTKSRSHKIRTAVTVLIPALLFSIIIALIVVSQGVFDSVQRFNATGLNDRTLISIKNWYGTSNSFHSYIHNNKTNTDFIAEIEKAHSDMVANKKAVAKKYAIDYDPAVEDPSPIGRDAETKQKTITVQGMAGNIVAKIAQKKMQETFTVFDINAFLRPYTSALVLGTYDEVYSSNGLLSYMKDDKEKLANTEMPSDNGVSGYGLSILEQSVAQTAITNTSYKPDSGEIPAILALSTAENLLGLKPLVKGATNEEKLQRLAEVRKRIGEVRVSFCYRNNASRSLLARATEQQDEMKRNVDNKEYTKPTLIYKLPSESDCGAVTIATDTRSAEQKKQDANRVLFEKETGVYFEPMQYKLVVRGVGVSSDPIPPDDGFTSVNEFVSRLFGSSIIDDAVRFTIPKQLFDQIPEKYRPADIFAPATTITDQMVLGSSSRYIVEFKDKNEVRDLINKSPSGIMSVDKSDATTFIRQFGSSVLFVDNMRQILNTVLVWALIGVGIVATVIMSSVVARTISESRRESAVFRAVGAKKIDIATIYGLYAVLLSSRVVVASFVGGLLIALAVEVLLWRDATFGARFAYATTETNLEVHFIGIQPSYLLLVAIVIVLCGIIASIIPIIRNARRNPIADMREDG